jgi:hypothetical protein
MILNWKVEHVDSSNWATKVSDEQNGYALKVTAKEVLVQEVSESRFNSNKDKSISWQ